MAERDHDRACERGGVDEVGAAELFRVSDGIGEDQAAFGVCVEDFDGLA